MERLGLPSIQIQHMTQARMTKSCAGVCTSVFQSCRFLFKSHFSCQRHLIQFHNGMELFFQSPTLPSPHPFSLSSFSVPTVSCSLVSGDLWAPSSSRFPLLPSALPSALSPSLLGSCSSVWLLGVSPFL